MINWLRDHRQIMARTAGSLLAVILLVVLLKEESGEEIIAAVRRISFWYFLAALLAMLVSRIFVVGRWHALLRSADMDISFSRTSRLTFTGLFASNFLPTTIGGDVVRLAGAMQLGYDRAVCLASMIADRLIGMAGMTFTLPFGLIPMLSLGKTAAQAAFFAPLYKRGVEFIRRTFETFKIWFNKPIGLLLSLLSTFGNMAFIFASLYLLISGMDRHVSYWLIAGLWSLTYFVALIPISINGYGVQELSLTFLLSTFGGLSQPESAVIAILIRLLFIVTSMPGAFFLPSILAEMNKSSTRN